MERIDKKCICEEYNIHKFLGRMGREGGHGNVSSPHFENCSVRRSFSWGLPCFSMKVKYATYEVTYLCCQNSKRFSKGVLNSIPKRQAQGIFITLGKTGDFIGSALSLEYWSI